MAYDEGLAQRVREMLADQPDLEEKKMFGGIAFMLQGNVACGLTQDNFMVRVGPEEYEAALARRHARPMDFTGKPMKGWVYVDSDGYTEDEDLAEWVSMGIAYALSLPPK